MKNNRLVKLLQEGYSVSEVLSAAKYGTVSHIYIPVQYMELFSKIKLYIVEKDGQKIVVTEDE